jgi:hypothetical protein
MTKKHYESATIWVNVYAYEFFHANGGSTWRNQAYQYQDRTFWHEMFHTVGLNDDAIRTIPGLMVWRALINRPNGDELDVSRFLYG